MRKKRFNLNVIEKTILIKKKIKNLP